MPEHGDLSSKSIFSYILVRSSFNFVESNDLESTCNVKEYVTLSVTALGFSIPTIILHISLYLSQTFLFQEEYHSNISHRARLTSPCQVKATMENRALWYLNYRSIIGPPLDGIHVKLRLWRTPLIRSTCLPGCPRKSFWLFSFKTLTKLIRFVKTLSRMSLPELWTLVLLNFWKIYSHFHTCQFSCYSAD